MAAGTKTRPLRLRPVPEPARPLPRAIDETNEAAFHMFVYTALEPIEDAASAVYEFAAALGWLLRAAALDSRFANLHRSSARGSRCFERTGFSTAATASIGRSHIALYSSFRTASAADRGIDKRISRATATT